MQLEILMSSPDITDLEEKYVLAALRSGWVAPLGPDVDKFEHEIAARVGVGHAVALSSGTAGLHLALLAAGVQPGDLVLTSSMTFAATANAITYTGAKPVFVDCERQSGNMDPNLLQDALRKLTKSGIKPTAIVPVDLLGKTVNYTDICGLARDFDVPVIADAAESLGASHAGVPAGGWGTASVFSFNGNKIMTTSGGGMVTTDDEDLASRVRYLATQARQPAVHYEHTEVGYNYRLSNILAALGRAQLTRLDDMMRRRRLHREAYRAAVRSWESVEIFGGTDDEDDNCWLTALVLDPRVNVAVGANSMRSYLNRTGIECRPLWKPMHLQPVYKHHQAFTNGNSQFLFENGVTLPSGSILSVEAVGRVTDALQKYFGNTKAA
jgi:dTDP-4-amino-4,6-dideoxygalactose transaminase